MLYTHSLTLKLSTHVCEVPQTLLYETMVLCSRVYSNMLLMKGQVFLISADVKRHTFNSVKVLGTCRKFGYRMRKPFDGHL